MEDSAYFISRAGEERQLGEVTVLKRERGDDKRDNRESMLRPERSLGVRNHSPDGFEFGYGGSGPAQLALAILLDVTDSAPRALAHYQAFKFEFIAKLRHPGGKITVTEIQAWLAKREGGRPPMREEDVTGVLGADGQVYSDADGGL